jgi:alanyl-tRNA synthetase
VVLVTNAQTGGVLLAASADSGVDAGQTLRPALQAAGGRGGGSPRVAQGTVASPSALPAVIAALGF